MKRALAAVALGCVLAACVGTKHGAPVPVGDPASNGSGTSSAAPGATFDPGIVPTTQILLPANAPTCPKLPRFPVSVRAAVSDPAAPIITIGFPDDWSMTSRPRGDVGAVLEGQGGMSALVMIVKTELGAAQAFGKYVDDAMAAARQSSVSVMPADLCGYSGQTLAGVWSDGGQDAVVFFDRLLHIWTNQGAYLVAVHLQAPAGTTGFDAAASVLMQDFAIVIP